MCHHRKTMMGEEHTHTKRRTVVDVHRSCVFRDSEVLQCFTVRIPIPAKRRTKKP